MSFSLFEGLFRWRIHEKKKFSFFEDDKVGFVACCFFAIFIFKFANSLSMSNKIFPYKFQIPKIFLIFFINFYIWFFSVIL